MYFKLEILFEYKKSVWYSTYQTDWDLNSYQILSKLKIVLILQGMTQIDYQHYQFLL